MSRLVDNGTTLAVYFGTIHNNGTEELARAVLRKGQRAQVGKVRTILIHVRSDWHYIVYY